MGLEASLLGSALIGGISTNSAAKRAERAQGRSDELNAKNMANQQDMQLFNTQRYLDSMLEYEKMKAIYGPLQEDVGTYFKNLTGESLSNDRIAKIQIEAQKANDTLRQNLAQSGRADTGLEQYLLNQNSFNTATLKAQTRNEADSDALQQKMSYLGLTTQQANQFRVNADNYAALAQNNINQQGQTLQTMGAQGINTAGYINSSYGSYTNQLQGLVGFKYRMDSK